jgi:putative acetyltransferase
MSSLLVRDEAPADVDAIRDVVTRAFEQPAEADLVDALRRAGKATISLVAERGGRVVGHVLFSPVTLAEAPRAPFASGLAPLAVLPEMQRQGIGAALVRAGLARCRAGGHAFVVVLGSPAYYGRFGFVDAERHRLHSEYQVPPGVFQVIEIAPDALAGKSGLVRYADEFAGF